MHLPLIARRPVKSVSDPAAPTAAADGAAPLQAVRLGGQSARRGFANAADGWTLRRLVAVAVLSPVLLALMVGAAGGWAPSAAPGWTAVVALAAVAAAGTLATYLPRPGAGHRLDLGCTPCAMIAALSVFGAAAVLHTAPHDASTAAFALVIVGFGLTQRLTSPSTCAAPQPSHDKRPQGRDIR